MCGVVGVSALYLLHGLIVSLSSSLRIYIFLLLSPYPLIPLYTTPQANDLAKKRHPSRRPPVPPRTL